MYMLPFGQLNIPLTIPWKFHLDMVRRSKKVPDVPFSATFDVLIISMLLALQVVLIEVIVGGL